MRLRVRFVKLGRVRFTSHRDVARMWERAVRRIGLPVARTEGFSPRPKLAFGLALSTGHESLAEYLPKGKQIYVEGKLQTRKWKDKDGHDKYTTEIRGDRVVLLSGGGGSRGEGAGSRASSTSSSEEFAHAEAGGSVELTDDDIPF